MKEWVWSTGGKKLKFSGRNLFHCHFVYPQSCIDHPGIKTRPPQWETVIICLSHGHLQFETLLDLMKSYDTHQVLLRCQQKIMSVFVPVSYFHKNWITVAYFCSIPDLWKFLQCFLSYNMMMDRQDVVNLFCMFSLQMPQNLVSCERCDLL